MALRALSIPLPNGSRISVIHSLPFFLVHFAVLAVFFIPFHWYYLFACLGIFLVRMFFVTAGYHRYFSHRSFKTSRVFQFMIAFIAMISDKYNETRFDYIGDFAKYPELRWLNKYHMVPPVAPAAAIILIGGWPLFVWGFCLSTVMLWHDTFTINSLSHLFGSRRYETTDTSKNNWLLALMTLGEGWHNNHHHFMASARQGFFWWEVDITYYTLKVLSWFGIVWDLRKVPPHLLSEQRVAA